MSESKKPMVIYRGIPIYADEPCPKNTAYIISVRTEWERQRLREIFGKDFVEGVVLKK